MAQVRQIVPEPRGGELVLKSARGQAWRFEESEDRVWRRVPATANPILLLRK